MSGPTSFDPARYLTHAEMTAALKGWADGYPELCALAEAGRSPQGRAIWAVTLTSRGTGSDRDKPGYMIDANIHAGEVTGGAAALYSIWWLLNHYGDDPLATELLDTRAVYVLPRLAVDGVEAYLTTPHSMRSAPRLYPHSEEPPGFYPEDVNGDGLIQQMRLVHPDGDWKAFGADPRIMVSRLPEDGPGGGPYYKVYGEGLIRDWDGRAIPPTVRRWGLDLNRNYPAFWNPEGRQPGAGPYPLSEPESRALATFLVEHPNIGAYLSYHTTGHVLLRPPSNGGDEKMVAADLEPFKRIGEMCTRITGAPCKSTYEAFWFPGQEALVKGADDWAYEHFGIQAYTFELWSIDGRSGARGYAEVGVKGLVNLTEEQWLEDERKRLAYSDRELGGKGFIPWTPWRHPQLGPVEIGGWDLKRCLQNPPEGPILESEIAPAAQFTFRHALATPRLALSLQSLPLGAGLSRITARVRNLGGLATNVTEMAVTMKAVRPIEVRLEAGPGVELLSGARVREIGHLEGWAVTGGKPARDEAWVDWVLRAVDGGEVRVAAATPRAGRASAVIHL